VASSVSGFAVIIVFTVEVSGGSLQTEGPLQRDIRLLKTSTRLVLLLDITLENVEGR